MERFQLVGQLLERKFLEWLQLERLELVERRMARSELGLMKTDTNYDNRLGASWG